MYCGCLMMFVCFISHVIQHCNVFSPWILKYSPWTFIAGWWVWDCSASPPPSCLPDLPEAQSFGRWFGTKVFRREVPPKPELCLTGHCCCAQQHHRVLWAGGITGSSSPILKYHKCTDPGRSQSTHVLSCSSVCAASLVLHQPLGLSVLSHVRKHMPEHLSQCWLPEDPEGSPSLHSGVPSLAPGGGSENLLGDLCTSQRLLYLCRMSKHIALNWQQLGCWARCFLHV